MRLKAACSKYHNEVRAKLSNNLLITNSVYQSSGNISSIMHSNPKCQTLLPKSDKFVQTCQMHSLQHLICSSAYGRKTLIREMAFSPKLCAAKWYPSILSTRHAPNDECFGINLNKHAFRLIYSWAVLSAYVAPGWCDLYAFYIVATKRLVFNTYFNRCAHWMCDTIVRH